ncbi:MAG: hypothetical protein AB1297_09225, partial [bacterium]
LKAIGIMLQLGNGKIDFIDGGWFLTKPQDPEGSTATLDITSAMSWIKNPVGLNMKQVAEFIGKISGLLPPSGKITPDVISLVSMPTNAGDYISMSRAKAKERLNDQGNKFIEKIGKEIGESSLTFNESAEIFSNLVSAVNREIENYIANNRNLWVPDDVKFNFYPYLQRDGQWRIIIVPQGTLYQVKQ